MADAELRLLESQLKDERERSADLQTKIAEAETNFEIGKKQLEKLLHGKAGRDASGKAAHADADASFVQSLDAQLRTTLNSLDEAKAEEERLRSELMAQEGTATGEQREGSYVLDGLDSSATVRAKLAMEQLRNSAEEVAKTRAENPTMRQTWRERTLPNVAIVSDENRTNPERETDTVAGSATNAARNEAPVDSKTEAEGDVPVDTGSVVERVFDGIVTFVPGLPRSIGASLGKLGSTDRSKEQRIVGSAEPQPAPENLFSRVARQYAALSLRDETSSSDAKLVAMSSTLDHIKHLLEGTRLLTRNADASSADWPSSQPAATPARVISASAPSSRPGTPSHATSRRRHHGSANAPPVALDPPRLSHPSEICKPTDFAKILGAAPARFHGSDLKRLYCTRCDGISLTTLLGRTADASPSIITIQDTQGRCFGCYASSPWKDGSKFVASRH